MFTEKGHVLGWWGQYWFGGGKASDIKLLQARDVFNFVRRGPHSKFLHDWNARKACAPVSIKRVRVEETVVSALTWYIGGGDIYMCVCVCAHDSFSSLFCFSLILFFYFVWCFSIQVGKQRLVGLFRDGWKGGKSVWSWILWDLLYFILCNHLYLTINWKKPKCK